MQQLTEIAFSYNWNNKLSCNTFTTIRVENPKYVVDKEYLITLCGTPFGIYRIVDIKTLKLDAINEWVARLDTGYSKEKCINLIRTMYKNKNINFDTQNIMLILLEKTT